MAVNVDLTHSIHDLTANDNENSAVLSQMWLE